VVPCVAFW
jgi:hypothetical protein